MDRRMSTRLSKFLSLVLRHRPDEYDLQMDEEGFVDFDTLIDVLVAEDIAAESAEDDVRELVEGSDRRRFEIADGKIRALYGHSSRIRLNYPADDPPPVLYHGTTEETARRVAKEGLKPAGRALVHLSGTEEEALSVGGRHTDDPVLIKVDTVKALDHEIGFHQATDLIWLCSSLPVDVLEIPELPDAPAPSKPASRPEGAPAPSSRPTGGVKAADPPAPQGFQRRTRRKGTRR
ncbi:MAG: putative RNA 2'-phosphotransferase [Gemmatimonadota bacterium]|nr:MAG: putative RNA 2'-phosphotransferase [Gemmatimonadota bacterium]